MKKQILSLLLALCLVIGLMPVTAFAKGETGVFTVSGGTLGTDYTYDTITKTLTILGGALTVGSAGTERGNIIITGDCSVTLKSTQLETLNVQADATINLHGVSTDYNKGAITIAEGKTVNIHTLSDSRLFVWYAPVFYVGSGATVNFSGTAKLTIETWNKSDSGVIVSSGNLVFNSGVYEIIAIGKELSSVQGGTVTMNGGILHLQSDCSSTKVFNEGIVSEENKTTYTIYGNQTLPAELETIAEGKTLVVDHNATLTVPEGKTLTNNGSVAVRCGGSIVGAVSGTAVVVENHSYGADDGNCLTAVVCSGCGGDIIKAKTSHDYDNNHDTTCNNTGCTAGNREKIHTWATTLTKNDAGHWYACSGCNEKKDYAPHSGTADADCTTATVCTCGYIITAAANAHTYTDDHDTICNADGCTAGNREKIHTYGTDWKSDKDNHWHECTCCDKKDTAAHTPKIVNVKEATASEKGYTGDTVCEICGYEIAKGKEIPVKVTPTEPNEDEPTSPETGDNSNVVLWFSLLIVSALGLVGATVISKKRNANR